MPTYLNFRKPQWDGFYLKDMVIKGPFLPWVFRVICKKAEAQLMKLLL